MAENQEYMSQAFLEVRNLCKYFVVGKDFFGRPNAWLKAVDNVSFKIEKGKTLGIVGESGCGKTTMGRTILRLHDITSGEVWFKGEKVSALTNREFDKRRPNMQMIFQDPYASLSPRLTVGEIIGEAARQHGLVDKKGFYDYVVGVMKMCGLQPHYFERYPHEFSGGQRQRICIARALMVGPKLLICDEAISALDVSIQAQVVNMLAGFQREMGLTYLFIAHDLSMVRYVSHRVGVMYLGHLMEVCESEEIYKNPLHPYTRGLLGSVPIADPRRARERSAGALEGEVPSPIDPPPGCPFAPRCPHATDVCRREAPPMRDAGAGHMVSCHAV